MEGTAGDRPRRGKGRPRKGEAPALPIEELDRLLVFGELVETSSAPTIRYPSYSELAERFGVSGSLVARYAAEHNCLKRRSECAARVEAKADQRMVEMRSELAAKTREDELRIIDGYIEGFEQALADGRIRFDSPADFNSMVRLKQFVLGGADSRSEVATSISLEEIQRRHRQQLTAAREIPAEAFGVVGGAVAGEVPGNPETEAEDEGDAPPGQDTLPGECPGEGFPEDGEVPEAPRASISTPPLEK